MRNGRDIPPGILCLLFCFTICLGIYIPSQEEAKPAYTAGIKKTFRKPSDAATFQNYSKVVVDNKPNTPAASYARNEYRTVEIRNIYPVYNAHTYGQIPPQNRTNILQTKSHQEINAGKIGFSTEHPNKTIIKRKIESKTIEVYSKCFPGATGQFIYSSSCNQFLNCWKGRGSVQNCAPGTLFNPKSLECDFPEKVQCVSGPQSNSFEQYRVEKSVEQADCPDGFSGIIPDYFDCSKFIQCDHGVSYKMDCAPGTLFDMKNNLCDYPYKATCFNGENAIDIRMKPNTHFTNTNTGGTTCNNENQNCGQTSRQPNNYGYNYQQTVHTGSYCNPRIQNCNTGHSTTYGQGTTYDQGTHYGQGTNTRNDNYGGYIHYGQVGNEVETKVSSTQNGTNGQGTYSQGTYEQGTYNPELYGQGTYKPGSYGQGTYNPGSYGQGTYNSESYGQGTYKPVSYGQGTYNQQTYGQTTYDQGTSGQETSIYPQVSGSSGCNSATQNCKPSGQTVTYTQTVIQGCNPNLQNCGQSKANEGQQIYGSESGTTKCNPLTRNCQPAGEYLGNGHGELRRHNCNPAIHNCDQYISQFSTNTPGCNPTIQNCDQYIGQSSTNTYTYSGQTGSGQTDIAPTVDSTYTQTNTLGSGDGKQNVASCNPLVQKCITIYGPNTGYQTIPINKPKTGGRFVCNLSEPNCGHGQENQNTGENTPNYRKICNVHDTNCRQQQSTGTETVQQQPSNTQPVCPNGAVGMRKHPTDCKKYLTCGSGQTFVMDCAPGTLFNDKTGMCDFPYNVKCEVTAESVDTVPSDTQYEQNVINYQKTTTERSYNPYPDSNKWNQQSNTKWNQQTDNNWNENRGSNWGQQTTNWDLHNGQQTINNAKQETDIWDQQPVAENNRGQTGYIKNPTKKPVYPDYDDVYNPNSHAALATTPRSASLPTYETGNNNIDVDYIFTYDDGTLVTLDPKNVRKAKEKISTNCEESDFRCSSNLCISLTMVCDGDKDCPDGKDEDLCEEYTQRFSVTKNAQLVVVENQRWINVSYSTCALLCVQNTKFTCRSFTYRKSDKTCFLSDKNIGLSGALQPHQSSDYSELKDGTIDCSDKSKYFECPNKRCLSKDFLCDGYDDCGDRHDEKHCDPKKFQYSIKLAGGKETHEGRVEVKAFGSEGYICDDEFGIEDANVICRELGFELGAAEVKGQSQFAEDLKESSTLYMIDDLNCRGNESTIIDCTFPGWGIHNCKDQEIAGVVCKTPQEKCGEDSWKCDSGKECIPFEFVCDGVEDCADDSDESNEHCEAPTELRLKEGSHSAEGRIEIKHNGIWGTICDDDFNEDAGKVVCKLLGYKSAVTVKKDGYFGAGIGPIWLDQVSCYGNETELHQCTHWNWGEHNCEHSEDVGVICTNEIGQVQIERHSNLPRRIEEGLPTNCGYRKDNMFAVNDLIQARVIGGGVAKKGNYPWQAALKVRVKDKSAHWCGAIIISSKWVLTAGHCLQGYTKGAYIIVAGEYNTDEIEGTEQQKYIDEFFVHEGFRKGHKLNNDIALIKVKGNGFELNDDVQPICLADADTDYSKELNCTISGFGSVKSGVSAYSHNLLQAWIPIHSKEICTMPHVYGDVITDGMFCAGSLDGGLDACDGDSGGPLACLDHGVFTLYGITSWGHHCGHANKPGVYVKVGKYRDWIEDIISEHSQ